MKYEAIKKVQACGSTQYSFVRIRYYFTTCAPGFDP
jgi:hypothetical protein